MLVIEKEREGERERERERERESDFLETLRDFELSISALTATH